MLHATGHTRRVTLSYIAMNNSVCSVEMGAAAKHWETEISDTDPDDGTENSNSSGAAKVNNVSTNL